MANGNRVLKWFLKGTSMSSARTLCCIHTSLYICLVAWGCIALIASQIAPQVDKKYMFCVSKDNTISDSFENGSAHKTCTLQLSGVPSFTRWPARSYFQKFCLLNHRFVFEISSPHYIPHRMPTKHLAWNGSHMVSSKKKKKTTNSKTDSLFKYLPVVMFYTIMTTVFDMSRV